MTEAPPETHLRAWRAVARLHQNVSDELERELAVADDLPLAWYDVLVTLRLRGGELRMHELAEATLISRSSATRLISKLESEGLVERRICPTDRRGVDVSLTSKGRERQGKAAPVVLAGLQRYFGRHLDESQAWQLIRTLESVLDAEAWLAPLPGERAGSFADQAPGPGA